VQGSGSVDYSTQGRPLTANSLEDRAYSRAVTNICSNTVNACTLLLEVANGALRT
jgi:hypothetical protein